MNYSPRQISILKLIAESRRTRGVAPSVREIARDLGGRDVKTVAEHLDRLEEMGAIEREHGKKRTLRVVDPEHSGRAGQVQIVGTIAAGRPIEAIEDPQPLEVAPMLHLDGSRTMYALRVRGDSMIEDGILDGDVVIVEKRETAENGQIVVAILENEEATLKRFYREKGRVRLQPANSSMKPIYVRQVQIRGVVRGVLRVAV
jgi:repressor LexA